MIIIPISVLLVIEDLAPSFDKLENFDYRKRVKLQHLSLYNFLTGKGGILYKPQFFQKLMI